MMHDDSLAQIQRQAFRRSMLRCLAIALPFTAAVAGLQILIHYLPEC